MNIHAMVSFSVYRRKEIPLLSLISDCFLYEKELGSMNVMKIYFDQRSFFRLIEAFMATETLSLLPFSLERCSYSPDTNA